MRLLCISSGSSVFDTVPVHSRLLGNLSRFLSNADFKLFRNTIRVSNSLDTDQARLFIVPDMGPNCSSTKSLWFPSPLWTKIYQERSGVLYWGSTFVSLNHTADGFTVSCH